MKHHNKISKNTSEKETKNKTLKILVFILIIVAIAVLILTFIPKSETQKTSAHSLKDICQELCDTNQRTAFCFLPLNIEKDIKGTCEELASNSDYLKYKIERCSAFSCEVDSTDRTCVNGLNGNWQTPEADGSCPQITGKIIRKVTSSDSAPIAGQICCREVLG